MFTDPQLGRVGLTEARVGLTEARVGLTEARVGLTEAEARKKGLPVKIAKLPMSKVARAIETGDTRGVLKAVVDAESGKILGAAVVGEEGGEIMSLLQMAMAGGVNYKHISDMIFAHPLYAESLNNLLELPI